MIENGSSSAPRDLPVEELINYTTVVDMQSPVVVNPSRKLGYKFMAAEAWWILTGQNRLSSIQPYANLNLFSNDGYHLDGAYGPQVVDQVKYVVDCLHDDPNTRQAVISIWRPNPRPSRDIPCTVSLQFLIRGNKLHTIATMRSSDTWLGLPYDIFTFTMITGYIALLYRAREPNVHAYNLGSLYINAGSQHLYRRDWQSCSAVQEAYSQDDDHYTWGGYFVPNMYDDPEELIEKLNFLKDTPGRMLVQI